MSYTYTERFNRKAVLQFSADDKVTERRLTRIRHQTDTVTHHTHFVQTRLTIEEYVAGKYKQIDSCERPENSLSILEMPLYDPSVLQKCIRPFIIPQIYTLSRVPHNISRARISRRTIPNQFL